jgi:hypothetical protein
VEFGGPRKAADYFLWHCRPYDVSGGDRASGQPTMDEDGAQLIQVVLNWAEELKQRVPTK